MKEHLRLLMVEDDESDAELVRIELERGGFDLDWNRVDTESGLAAALSQSWDIIISDFAMPGFSGLRAFDMYRRVGKDIPFIFVSGALGEDRAVQAMRAGARDYFLKSNLTRLTEAVRRELKEANNRRERRLADEMTLREQRRLALAIEASNAGVFELGLAGDNGVEFSGAWPDILGFDLAELPKTTEALGAWALERLHPEDEAAVSEGLRAFHAGQRERYAAEFRLRHRKGRWVDLAMFARAMERGPGGAPTRVAGVVLDQSASRQLEAQLRQAQKMEAVGQLAGGVAHDFNNLLTAILSFGTFALEAVPASSPEAQDIQEVLRAAQRAQTLTSQLLAFSRKTAIAPRIVNLNDVVDSAGRILARLLGADIDLKIQTAPELGNAKIDREAFEQVLLNLAVNARDAMPEGGQLTIETDNVFLDTSPSIGHGADVPPGDYVVIAVSDSGTGMTPETQARIFEPFFTTKEPGRGTGLGLSTCYGIVKQAEGFIWVYSELGKGTTFRVYLPRVAEPKDVLEKREEPLDPRGTETILVAEDDDQVRQLAVRSLKRLGYTVIEATNGEDALKKCADPNLRVDLLLTDVVMPVLGGRQLVDRLKALRPSLPALYMSGYAQAAITHRGVLDPGTHIIQKPFTPDMLTRRIRQILDASRAHAIT
ncbi:MAG TPA: response regulator [Polyangia bacterium]|nr:response regulator [Polyangia bacterium]